MLTSNLDQRIIHDKGVLVTFGCDPEMFIARDGEIVESADAIGGLGNSFWTDSGNSKIVQDGVQVELNPSPSSCRASVINSTAQLINTLAKTVKKKGMEISFQPVVKLDPEALAKMSEAAKRLGCLPSFNAYDAKAEVKVGKDFATRSAGGHIHIGYKPGKTDADYNRFANILDIIVGNTCVMIDRDPSAAERRKTYGRAGEYRKPLYGFEYRTLSNFWLRSSQLMSMVMGLCRLAVLIHNKSQRKHLRGNNWDPAAELLASVDMNQVTRAINENDLELAKLNWAPVRAFIDAHVEVMEAGLDTEKLDNFDYFLSEIESKGLERWFPLEPLQHWSTVAEGHGIGWEAWIDQCVEQVKSENNVSRILEKIRGA